MSEQDKSKTVAVTATPEWLAEQAVTGDREGNIWLRWPDGKHLANIPPMSVHEDSSTRLACTGGLVVRLVRRWLVEQIEGAYKAGVEAGRKQSLGDCQSWPEEASAALRSAEETSRIAKDEARQSCINDLAAALDAATPVAWESLMQEVKRLKTAEAENYAAGERASVEGIEIGMRNREWDIATVLGKPTATSWGDLVQEVRWLKAQAAAAPSQEAIREARQQEARIVRAMVYADIGDALCLVRATHDEDEALVREEIARLRKDEAFVRSQVYEYVACLLGIKFAPATDADGEAAVHAEIARLVKAEAEAKGVEKARAAFRDDDRQGFDVSQAMALARVGDMLGLNREHNDDDEALVSAEIARLLKVAADAEKKVTPDEVAKARAEGEKAGYQRALAVVATYMRGCEDAALKAQTDVQDLQSKLSLAKDRLDKATATADAVHDVLIDLHETENMP